MDILDISNSICQEFNRCSNPLSRVCLENHIYGCFVILEDICDNCDVNIIKTTLNYSELSFNYLRNFNKIGVTFGFLSKDAFTLNDFSADYLKCWIELISYIYECKNIKTIDDIEDIIYKYIKENVANNYFHVALENDGLLDDNSIKQIESLLTPDNKIVEQCDSGNSDGNGAAIIDNSISGEDISGDNVIIENKPVITKISKKYSKTRRRLSPVIKRSSAFNKTRKNIKNKV
jgi:hypothetical protein